MFIILMLMAKELKMKNNLSVKKLNIITIIILILLIGSLSIGYSILSTNLSLNTTITLRSDLAVRITALSEPISINEAYENYTSRFTENTITNNITLPNLNSTISYDVTLTNNSGTAIKITDINNDVFNNSNCTYDLTNIANNTVINNGENLIFRITYRYLNTITSIPDNQTLGSIIKINYEEYIPTILSYVTDGLQLNLEGTTAPQNNTWIDSANNHIMNLNNVNYNPTAKCYDFSSTGSYATLGSPLIPATGDFTLEANVILPASIPSNADQAIIAQVSDTSNDSGRFKLNLRLNTLITFVNQSGNNSNATFTFNSNVNNSERYLLQLVRNGNIFQLYLNGIKIGSDQNFSSTNKISQGPLKIGRWNSNSVQQFTGSVYAVRLYNRALNQSELQNNSTVDANNYQVSSQTSSLIEYVIANQVITSNSGLYNTALNTYIYKGTPSNNYLKFENDNEIYRIIGFYNDNTMKLIGTNLNTNIAYDSSGNRSYTTSTYCDKANTLATTTDYYGCNYYATTTNYNNKQVISDSTIKSSLDNWYNNLSNNIKSYIVNHDFAAGFITNGSAYETAVAESKAITYNGFVAPMGAMDVIDSMISKPATITTSLNPSTYLVQLTTSTSGIWTINGSTENSYDVWAVAYGSQFARKRASRTSQLNGSTTALLYAIPSFYVNSNYQVTGDGTLNNPFIVQE